MWTTARAAIWLGRLSVGALVLQALALHDISHGEADVRMEWAAVQAALLISAAFHVVALRALRSK